MAIDRQAYKADKKKYKSAVKENKQKQKQYKRNVKSETKRTNKANKAEEKKQRKNPGSIKTFHAFHVMKPKVTKTGEKPKRSDYNLGKDDMGNKGSRSGKGPKPMKVKEKGMSTTDKGIMSRYGAAQADMVKRFQGSTKKLGNTTAMKAMLNNAIKGGLAADLGKKLSQATVTPKPKMPSAQMGRDLGYGTLVSKKTKEIGGKKPFTPSKRDMELKDAHLGTPPQQSADPAKLTYKKAGGPVKPKDKKAKR